MENRRIPLEILERWNIDDFSPIDKYHKENWPYCDFLREVKDKFPLNRNILCDDLERAPVFFPMRAKLSHFKALILFYQINENFKAKA